MDHCLLVKSLQPPVHRSRPDELEPSADNRADFRNKRDTISPLPFANSATAHTVIDESRLSGPPFVKEVSPVQDWRSDPFFQVFQINGAILVAGNSHCRSRGTQAPSCHSLPRLSVDTAMLPAGVNVGMNLPTFAVYQREMVHLPFE
jgi:hypothetical protein